MNKRVIIAQADNGIANETVSRIIAREGGRDKARLVKKRAGRATIVRRTVIYDRVRAFGQLAREHDAFFSLTS